MGWLLKKPSRAGKKPAFKSPKKRRPWDPKRTLLGLEILGGVLAVVAVALLWRSAERGLVSAAQEAYAAGSARVELINAPAWIDPEMVLHRHLRELVATQLSDNPLNTSDLSMAAAALAQSPWVREVHWVRRSAEGVIRVSAGYREPLAMVETYDQDGKPRPEGYGLIDAEGLRLPGLYPAHAAGRLRLPVVRGVASPAPKVGKLWPSTHNDMASALSLLKLLRPRECYQRVLALDVREPDIMGRVGLALQLTDRQMWWGLPPGMGAGLEVDDQRKLHRLSRWAAEPLQSASNRPLFDLSASRTLRWPGPSGG